MGLLNHFKIETPRPTLVEAVEEIETAMCRLTASTDQLADLLDEMNAQSARQAAVERTQKHGA